MFKRAQTATEYLIILAVVIITSLVVVSILSDIPAFGNGASSNVVKAQLANYGPLKIDEWVVLRNETIVVVQNNDAEIIKIDSITLNGTTTNVSKIVGVGQKISLSLNVTLNSPNEYSFPLSFSWTDVSTSASYTENEEFAILSGMSVNSPFFVYARKIGGSSTNPTVNQIEVPFGAFVKI